MLTPESRDLLQAVDYTVVPSLPNEHVSYEGHVRRATRALMGVTVLTSPDHSPTFPQARITVSNRRVHLDLSEVDLPEVVSYP